MRRGASHGVQKALSMVSRLESKGETVDLVKSFQASIYLQNSASIQPVSSSVSNIATVTHLFVPLRYLQFLKIIRSTAAAAAAENEPCQVCRTPRNAAAAAQIGAPGRRGPRDGRRSLAQS